jgi:hypothetical protein
LNKLTRKIGNLLIAVGLTLFVHSPTFAQNILLNENCTVSILNRTVQPKPDGTWVLPNVPANFGQVRARATCVENGITRSGQSDYFTIPVNGAVTLPGMNMDVVEPIPTSLQVTSATSTLTAVGASTQLMVTGVYPDGSTRNLTAMTTGTSYRSSNAGVASVSPEGLITARSSGTALISASNEGALGVIRLRVLLSGDADGDGIPDDVEALFGLDPNNPADALQDFDNDGLTNRQELDLDTNIRVADTDGDGLPDGQEITLGTNPLSSDTDGDGIRDLLEIQTGSDPTNPASLNLAQALVRLEVSPAAFTIVFNTIMGEATRQLTVTGVLKDGTRMNLTATARGTNYRSSDLTICNFGAPDGRVFAGQSGICTITVTNSGFGATAWVIVKTVSPTALSSIAIPGYANNVDVAGNCAYVAAGSTGLQIVDVKNPVVPRIVGSRDTTGTAIDVRIVGDLAYMADGESGLVIFDISNPVAPTIIGSLDTPGIAQDLVVSGARLFIADGESGLQIIDVSNPTAPTLLGTVDTPGTAKGVSVSGNYGLVGDGSALQVIDLTDPNAPQIVGTVNIPGDTQDVVARNDYAYIAAYTGGLQIVDFSIPSNPRIIGSIPSSFVPRDLELGGPSGQFAFFAEQLFPNVVAISDITNPASPIFRAILDLSSSWGLCRNRDCRNQ